MWIWKCEFCQEYDFEDVNFLNYVILNMIILDKIVGFFAQVCYLVTIERKPFLKAIVDDLCSYIFP